MKLAELMEKFDLENAHPIFKAAAQGDVATVELYLQERDIKGKQTCPSDYQVKCRKTHKVFTVSLINIAAIFGQVKMVDFLLTATDPKWPELRIPYIRTSGGALRDTIKFTCWAGELSVLERLLKEFQHPVNQEKFSDRDNYKALIAAAGNGHLAVVRKLLEVKWADPNLVINECRQHYDSKVTNPICIQIINCLLASGLGFYYNDLSQDVKQTIDKQLKIDPTKNREILLPIMQEFHHFLELEMMVGYVHYPELWLTPDTADPTSYANRHWLDKRLFPLLFKKMDVNYITTLEELRNFPDLKLEYLTHLYEAAKTSYVKEQMGESLKKTLEVIESRSPSIVEATINEKLKETNRIKFEDNKQLIIAHNALLNRTVAKLPEPENELNSLLLTRQSINEGQKINEELLEYLQLKNSAAETSYSHIFYAAAIGKLEKVKQLLDKVRLSNSKLLYQAPKGYLSLLDIAALFGQKPVVDFLLAQNIEVEKEPQALIFACKEGHAEVMTSLLEAYKYEGLDPVGRHAYLPLLSAAERGRFEMVKQLLEDGRSDPVDAISSWGIHYSMYKYLNAKILHTLLISGLGFGYQYLPTEERNNVKKIISNELKLSQKLKLSEETISNLEILLPEDRTINSEKIEKMGYITTFEGLKNVERQYLIQLCEISQASYLKLWLGEEVVQDIQEKLKSIIEPHLKLILEELYIGSSVENSKKELKHHAYRRVLNFTEKLKILFPALHQEWLCKVGTEYLLSAQYDEALEYFKLAFNLSEVHMEEAVQGLMTALGEKIQITYPNLTKHQNDEILLDTIIEEFEVQELPLKFQNILRSFISSYLEATALSNPTISNNNNANISCLKLTTGNDYVATYVDRRATEIRNRAASNHNKVDEKTSSNNNNNSSKPIVPLYKRLTLSLQRRHISQEKNETNKKITTRLKKNPIEEKK